MTETEIHQIVEEQRYFFHQGTTLDVSARLEALQRLKTMIQKNEKEIHEALCRDLGKSGFESYMCETGLVLSEITYMQKHIKSFAKEQRVPTPLSQFPSRSYRKPSPYGVTLIMSPWNYPFLLTVEPLVDAIAAGNTAVVKPSAYSPATSALLERLLTQCFDRRYVAVVTGGRGENTCLLSEHFDYIFFTGSPSVGREVMQKAAAHLTPVTLELGGKSPCIVDQSADIRLAAKRIVFGKFLNCGQTCVAPDYIYCDAVVKDRLVKELKRQIKKQFGASPLTNAEYGKIINEKHFSRILRLIEPSKVVYGGGCDPASLKIEPTLMDNVSFSDDVMQEEIFGPVLPVLTYASPDEAVRRLQTMAHPLAFYVFAKDPVVISRFTSDCGFGGGCVNDTVIHLATSRMGFGGFGESGMGTYHGKDGFDTFTHYKSIVDKKTWLDLPMRYHPYRRIYERLIRFFLK